MCPGPSLNKWQGFFCQTGHMIAVNGAMSKYPADYWAMCDEEVFNDSIHKIPGDIISRCKEETILWIPGFWLNHADRRLHQLFRIFKYETWENLSLEMKIGAGLPWRNYTMFCGIALAILKGAKHIFMYGADMSGSGYFAPGFENSRTRHDEKRWEDEWFWFKRISLECRAHNIEIMRMIPSAKN